MPYVSHAKKSDKSNQLPGWFLSHVQNITNEHLVESPISQSGHNTPTQWLMRCTG